MCVNRLKSVDFQYNLGHPQAMTRKLDRPQGQTAVWLLEQIENFIELNNLDNDGNSFGWYVAKDRAIVQRLRDGGDVTITRMDDILAFMQNPPVSDRRALMKPMKIKRRILQ